VTVPNHAFVGCPETAKDQAIFDFSFSTQILRSADSAGDRRDAVGRRPARAVGGLVQILFWRRWPGGSQPARELAALAAMFLLPRPAAAVIARRPVGRWRCGLWAATALTIAYMAVGRWLIAGALGIFMGSLACSDGGYGPVCVLTGAAIGEMLLIALFGFVSPASAGWLRACGRCRCRRGCCLGSSSGSSAAERLAGASAGDYVNTGHGRGA
jgi:hypothetical protein